MTRPTVMKIAIYALLASFAVNAQEANPTSRPQQQAELKPDPNAPQAIFRIEVVARTTQAVNYLHRGGSTKIDFAGTALLASGKGQAKVESERGVIKISAEFKNLNPPSSYGPEYLTYVLWAISPDGRPVNLGELTLSDYGMGSTSKIDTTSPIQTFGMIVTAEPYYAVTIPSDVVVMENVVRQDTQGVVENINAKYQLLPRGMYTNSGRASGFTPVQVGKKDPFELYEARNAVQLARVAGADKYASDSFAKAEAALAQAEKYQVQKPGQKPVMTMAREAAVRAEDARVIAIRAERAEALQQEREAGIARENAEKQRALEAQQKAEDEARARAQADLDRQKAEQAKEDALAAAKTAEAAAKTAQAEREAAEKAKAEALQAKAEADAARAKLADEAARAKAAAADADKARIQAENDKAQLRQRLLDQFNAILQTRDTTRGLIIQMSDVLFDTAQYTLKPPAREALARVAGIVLGHPGLKIAVEGHTDSVGSDDYNMKLSENRANSVREFLIAQGLDAGNVTAQGFGKTMPVAENNTAAGRAQNRRVELVVSGEILGTTLTSTRTTSTPQ